MPLDKYRKPASNAEPDRQSQGSSGASPRPKSSIGGRIFAFCFGAIFFAVGTLIVWNMGVEPLRVYEKAANWPAVRATILHSDVASHSDSDGTTYSFEVRYGYEYKGKTYESSRYRVSSVSTSNYSEHARLRDAYTVGNQVVAFVNPNDPYYAILVRTKDWQDYMPFAFVLFNIFGLISMISAFTGSFRILKK